MRWTSGPNDKSEDEPRESSAPLGFSGRIVLVNSNIVVNPTNNESYSNKQNEFINPVRMKLNKKKQKKYISPIRRTKGEKQEEF